MTRVIFVRHGETAHNAQMVITAGAPGGPLNERGAAQARQLATDLAGAGVSALYASPLARARQTAEILAEGLVVPLALRAELAECSVGDLEGRSDPLAFARFDSTADRWYHAEDLDYPLGPNGEDGRSAVRRVGALLAELARLHRDETIALVSHQTLLQLAITRLSVNLPPAFGYRRWIPNAGTVVTELRGADLHCLEWAGSLINSEGGVGVRPVRR
jgi:broad specificity phosphatase PhoE